MRSIPHRPSAGRAARKRPPAARATRRLLRRPEYLHLSWRLTLPPARLPRTAPPPPLRLPRLLRRRDRLGPLQDPHPLTARCSISLPSARSPSSHRQVFHIPPLCKIPILSPPGGPHSNHTALAPSSPHATSTPRQLVMFGTRP